MRIPKELNTVTTFSKLLALILFILFPILGFYLGTIYQRAITIPAYNTPILDSSYQTSPKPKATVDPNPTVKKSGEINATFQDSGKTITLKNGEKLRLSLSSTYWNFDKTPDASILKQLSDPVYETDKSQRPPGIGIGTVTVEYLAISKGQTLITASRNSCGEAVHCTGNLGNFVLNVVVN